MTEERINKEDVTIKEYNSNREMMGIYRKYNRLLNRTALDLLAKIPVPTIQIADLANVDRKIIWRARTKPHMFLQKDHAKKIIMAYVALKNELCVEIAELSARMHNLPPEYHKHARVRDDIRDLEAVILGDDYDD